MKAFTNLDDMIRSREFEIFQESKLGNDLFISDPDRAERIYDAAEMGGMGSTHAEIIEDWREYLKTLNVYDPEFDDDTNSSGIDITQEIYDRISKSIDDVEDWHDKNGSLNNQLG